MARLRHTICRQYITDFCGSIVWGWCRLEFLWKVVHWVNPRTNLWTFGFSFVYLMWFSAFRWYHVWLNWVNIAQSWRLFWNVASIGLLCNDLAVTMWRRWNVIFGWFEGSFGVGRQVVLSWNLLCWQCDKRGSVMITRNYSLKQHNTVEYLGCYFDSDLNGE